MGVNGAENGNKMTFERANGSLGRIGAMFLWRHSLKSDVIFGKSILEFLRAFVVEDVELGCMALLDKRLVNRFPSITDASGLTIGNSNGMNSISIDVIEDKNVIIAATRRDGKAAGLIGVGFEKSVVFVERDENLMTRRGKGGRQIRIDRSERRKRKRNLGGTQVLGFLILMTKDGRKILGRCLEMRVVVRPGMVVKCVLRMARRRVEGTGLPRAACR
jgi:hypothetical protein